MRNDWQKKEKKEKKKKKEAETSEAEEAGGDAGGEESSGGGGGAKKPVGNVFALFKQAQIQEFKEVWSLSQACLPCLRLTLFVSLLCTLLLLHLPLWCLDLPASWAWGP